MSVDDRLYRAVDEAKHLFDDDLIPAFQRRVQRRGPWVAALTFLVVGILVVAGASFLRSIVGPEPAAPQSSDVPQLEGGGRGAPRPTRPGTNRQRRSRRVPRGAVTDRGRSHRSQALIKAYRPRITAAVLPI